LIQRNPSETDAVVPLATPQSSCPPETLLKGLNYLKGQAPVLSLADDQYPDWLWTVLTPKEYPDDGPGGKAERVRRKKERQQAIKDRNFMSTQ
jgi:large subunit ribosomal protein L54